MSPINRKLKKKVDRVEFDTYQEFLDTVAVEGSWRAPESADSDSFHGPCSYTEAQNYAAYGWTEGLDKLQSRVDTLAPMTAQAPMREMSLNVAGFAPDVPSYLSNSPESMFQWEDNPTTGVAPILKFIINLGATATVTIEQMMNRGAAILALVDYFDAAGAQCDLFCASVGKMGDMGTAQYFIPLKTAGEVVELDRLAFALAHPCMMRRFMFRLREQCLEIETSTYGRSQKIPPKDAKDAIVTDPLHSDNQHLYDTPEKALKTVLATVRKQLPKNLIEQFDDDWKHVRK